MGGRQTRPSELALQNRGAALNRATLQQIAQLAASNGTVPREQQRFTPNAVLALLRGARDIYTAVAGLARQAKFTFDAISYEWDADSNVAQLMVSGIVDNVRARARFNATRNKKRTKARPPLQVRLVTDHSSLYGWMQGQAKSSEITRTVTQILNACGADAADNLRVEARVWRHETLASNHSKYFLQDVRTAIVTGCNIDALYDWERIQAGEAGEAAERAMTGAAKARAKVKRTSWHDTGIQLRGPVVATLDAAFEKTWAMATRFSLSTVPARDPRVAAAAAAAAVCKRGCVPVMLASKAYHRVNMSDVDNPQDVAWLYLMAHAKRHIWVETPNINDAEFQLEVLQAVYRRVQVRLLTAWKAGDTVQQKRLVGGGTNEEVINRLHSFITAHMPADRAAYFQPKWYSHDGVRPVEGYAEGQSHTKFMSVDGAVLMMGSGNQDTQSWKHSQETNVVVWDRDVTSRADAVFFLPDWRRGIDVRPQQVPVPRWYRVE